MAFMNYMATGDSFFIEFDTQKILGNKRGKKVDPEMTSYLDQENLTFMWYQKTRQAPPLSGWRLLEKKTDLSPLPSHSVLGKRR